ncbi:glycosyltransferase family 2 protein [Aurantimonas sp. E1-2-R+4]|uniref:glycosyltransferase family 2 protein n=1 Tax=Aurantimonas sp. E1-2-R+4 TaxID=3113714 RepID=UPI002F93361F
MKSLVGLPKTKIMGSTHMLEAAKIAVVIPAYGVRDHVLSVIEDIGPEVCAIYVVDDACPQQTGRFVEGSVVDPRVRVIFNSVNQGVGGATLVGMVQATADGADILVKIDGDGQMDPRFVPSFTGAIERGEADYTKGNRFFELEGLRSMPMGRLIGNAGLSLMTKVSTGYWHTYDPTNGFFAIHSSLIEYLPVEKISKRYFFESDLLFRLSIVGARIVDVPMHAHYGDETSGMQPLREIPRFFAAHCKNFAKRIFYNYFLRNFSIASVELALGVLLFLFGIVYGALNWGTTEPATAGTVMLAALPVIVGVQLLLAFLNYDIQSVPKLTLYPRLLMSTVRPRALRHHKAGLAASSRK